MAFYGKNQVYSQEFSKIDAEGRHYAEIILDEKIDEVKYMVYKADGSEVEKRGADKSDGMRSLKIKDGKGEAFVKSTKKQDVNKEVKPEKNPQTNKHEKPAYTYEESPSYHESWTSPILSDKTGENKLEPSEKIIKSYRALKLARDKNIIRVKAAQLLIQIAPNRVKEVRGQLDSLIKDSQELVKKADKMIEQLEAKYEF